ncbi:glycerophosphodiester phosphodiesterase family protein [Allonocardiopsis opalescens]|uniref:glycerophosphodiester phosphodiesterase n=1 Tax=Allonocardiopsis opalescens TaxID=1144618 RepID=A0A2T0QET7_9ACTN|nr:glycerophosphodiester phosphodiesterase family protein [Allonocardiopsis opalescens]PRY02447.1 glycerophosphoryl diester phosphodiesterase [Allonocardiopsis opalescens]
MTLTRRNAVGLAAAGTVAGVLAGTLPASADRREREQALIIAHRGASAHRPEHTILAYEAAIAFGADYIEPDLVSTRDHVLVARHENEIGGTTDVADHPEFADRRTTKTIDGRAITGWFTEDFTLAELRTLRATERVPDLRPDNTAFDGLAVVPTFDEVVRLAKENGVGVYPETKHPTYFDSIGLSLEEPLLDTLRRHDWTHRNDPVVIQSFETANLRRLRPRTRVRLAQLIDATGRPYDWTEAGDPRSYDTMVTPAGLREVASYADGVGVHTRRIVPQDAQGRVLPPTTLVRDAHRRDLEVHVWTVRNENSQLPVDYRLGDPASPVYQRAMGDVAGWLGRLLDLGVDGAFCDDPSLGRAVAAARARS